jgi:hypothetical protein
VALAKPILLCADHTLHTSLMQSSRILKRGQKEEEEKASKE